MISTLGFGGDSISTWGWGVGQKILGLVRKRPVRRKGVVDVDASVSVLRHGLFDQDVSVGLVRSGELSLECSSQIKGGGVVSLNIGGALFRSGVASIAPSFVLRKTSSQNIACAVGVTPMGRKELAKLLYSMGFFDDEN